jgi:natural product precursor
MKTIGNLKINKVKHLNDEELLLLRGGYDGDQHLCLFSIPGGPTFLDWWYCPGGCSSAEATQQCGEHYGYSASCDCGC